MSIYNNNTHWWKTDWFWVAIIYITIRFSQNIRRFWGISGQSLEIMSSFSSFSTPLSPGLRCFWEAKGYLLHEEVQLHELLLIMWEFHEHVSWSSPELDLWHLCKMWGHLQFGQWVACFSPHDDPRKLSALINVCPGSKYLRVTSLMAVAGSFTMLTKVVRRHQFSIPHSAVVQPVDDMRDILLPLQSTDIGKRHILCLPLSDALVPDHWNAVPLCWGLLAYGGKGLMIDSNAPGEDRRLHPWHAGQHYDPLKFHTADRKLITLLLFQHLLCSETFLSLALLLCSSHFVQVWQSGVESWLVVGGWCSAFKWRLCCRHCSHSSSPNLVKLMSFWFTTFR